MPILLLFAINNFKAVVLLWYIIQHVLVYPLSHISLYKLINNMFVRCLTLRALQWIVYQELRSFQVELVESFNLLRILTSNFMDIVIKFCQLHLNLIISRFVELLPVPLQLCHFILKYFTRSVGFICLFLYTVYSIIILWLPFQIKSIINYNEYPVVSDINWNKRIFN